MFPIVLYFSRLYIINSEGFIIMVVLTCGHYLNKKILRVYFVIILMKRCSGTVAETIPILHVRNNTHNIIYYIILYYIT